MYWRKMEREEEGDSKTLADPCYGHGLLLVSRILSTLRWVSPPHLTYSKKSLWRAKLNRLTICQAPTWPTWRWTWQHVRSCWWSSLAMHLYSDGWYGDSRHRRGDRSASIMSSARLVIIHVI